MTTTQISISQCDFLVDVFHLISEGRFPGKVDLSRKALPLVTSLIPLWFDDLTQAKAFRVQNAQALGLRDGEYVTFSCTIPLRRNQISGGYPVADDLMAVDETTAKELATRIEKDLPSQSKQRLIDDLELQSNKLKQERDTLIRQQEKQTSMFELQAQEFKLREEELKEREREYVQRSSELRLIESMYAPFLVSVAQNEVLQDKAASSVDNLYEKWPAMLHSIGHITSSGGFAERSLLLALLSVMNTGGLIVLDGAVGVGKTSVIKRSAKLLSGTEDRFEQIPVRPGWIDSTDLVGFYDPNHRDYQPSPFLTALNRAKYQPHRMHFICLDELNLARIENYGSDLLSCMEYRSTRSLPLYSTDVEQSLRRELASLATPHDGDLEFEKKIRGDRIAQTLKLFPAQFHISGNAIVLGTLNSDETTYDISPKVIDRSFVVRVPLADLRSSAQVVGEQLESCVIDFDSFTQAVSSTLTRDDDEWFRARLVEMQGPLRILGLPLGQRARQDIEIFARVAHLVGVRSREKIYQHFVHMKILPRIRFQRSERAERAWVDFERLLSPLLTKDLTGALENLKQQLDDPSLYSIRYFGISS